jgi:AcrR family transcriptional regulator
MAGAAAGKRSRPSPGQGRQALIDAAIALVGERGLRGLTYRAVAKAAGVTHALVTHHFGSREALLSEALASSVASVEHGAFRGEELDDFAATLADFIAHSEDLLAFQYELTMEARRQPQFADDIKKMYTDVLATIEERLAAFGCEDEDGSLGRLVLAAIDGLILQQLVFGREDQTEASVRVLRELIAQRASGDRLYT